MNVVSMRGTERIDGWRELAIHIVITALDDAHAGDHGAYRSLQPGGFCYRLLGYLEIDRDVLLTELASQGPKV